MEALLGRLRLSHSWSRATSTFHNISAWRRRGDVTLTADSCTTGNFSVANTDYRVSDGKRMSLTSNSLRKTDEPHCQLLLNRLRVHMTHRRLFEEVWGKQSNTSVCPVSVAAGKQDGSPMRLYRCPSASVRAQRSEAHQARL